MDAKDAKVGLHERPTWTIPLLTLWAGTITGVLLWMGLHAQTPGDNGIAPLRTRVSRSSAIEMHFFAHPMCPCTEASVTELQRLIARTGANPDHLIQAHVYVPDEEKDDWFDSPLTDRLRTIPGLTAMRDVNGDTAVRFGAVCSGHLLIYRNGRLVFSGGLTESRGHAGGSTALEAAHRAITAVDDALSRAPLHKPVYGCLILDGRTRFIDAMLEETP